VRVRLGDHFAGKPSSLRRTFQALRATVRRCGPATCYAQKTRIVFQARVRFAGVVVRRNGLELGLWLRRRVTHPALRRVESFGRLGYGHYFRLQEPSDLDDALTSLVKEAYVVARVGPVKGGAGAGQP
jgi:hypothetical protein